MGPGAADGPRGDRGATRRGGRAGGTRRWRAARCARRWTACATWSASPGARPPAAPRRATCARSATRSRGCRRSRRAGGARTVAAAALLAHRSRERVGRCADLAAEIQRTLVARPPLPVRRRRDDRRRGGCGARRAPRDRDGGQGRDRRAAGRGARRAPGIGSLKVGYNRVFGYYIESHERQPRARARGLPAPADAHGGGALRDAGAQGVRGEGAARDRADRGARAGAASRRCARAWAAAIARLQAVARRLARSSMRSRRWPRWRRARGTCGRRCTTGSALEIVRRAPPGGRADDAARPVHPERRDARRPTRG